MFNCR